LATELWRPVRAARLFLELNFTNETLEFTDITGKNGIANRGLLQTDIALGGIAYLQQISDNFDNSAQHFEPGLWVNVPATTNPNEPSTVARMASLPHGTTVNLQGKGFEVAQPQFQPASITPFQIGSPDDGQTNLQPFAEETIANASTSRTPLNEVAGLTQAHLSNPNLFLSEVIAKQGVITTTVLTVTSDTTVPNSEPNAGGGTANIAFLDGTGAPPTGGPNASTSRVTAIFWIERVRDEHGNAFDQLQYTQRVLLNFRGLSWPHITVATLRAE
jgi:prepilin-type processing-associated H-X9-DG protein